MIVELLWESTGFVDAVKVAVLEPAATITKPGTETEFKLLWRFTVIPPVPAGPLKVTVPVEEVPPVTDVGFKEMETSVAGVMVSFADCEVLPSVAVMFATT